MAFDPNNKVIQRCMQGVAMEEKGEEKEAGKIFLQAWDEAGNEFEKFTAAYYIARHQKNIPDKLQWLQTSLQLALQLDDMAVKGALHALYANIAQCYQDLNDLDSAQKYNALAISAKDNLYDNGPFYHGTRADLQVGDLLTAGYGSNYKTELVMNHIYFTALVNGAGLAAALAKGEGQERVYIVEPTGSFENDPNVTDKKFPGNPTRSYRTAAPLKIVGEATDWVRQTPEQIKQWRDKLANVKGDIIN
ncbi:MAG: NAD(+)--rifampin ADP-ribosyltransferase [Agriterribacter sp.]